MGITVRIGRRVNGGLKLGSSSIGSDPEQSKSAIDSCNQAIGVAAIHSIGVSLNEIDIDTHAVQYGTIHLPSVF